jgi:hypothetical protein
MNALKPLTVYKVSARGIKTGRTFFFVVRSDTAGRITVPRGYALLNVLKEVN